MLGVTFVCLSLMFIMWGFLVFLLTRVLLWMNNLFQWFLILPMFWYFMLNLGRFWRFRFRMFRHFGVFWMLLMGKFELFERVSFRTLISLNSFSLREGKLWILNVLPYLGFKYRFFLTFSLLIQNRIKYFFGWAWLRTDGFLWLPDVYVSGLWLFHKLLKGLLVLLSCFIGNYCRV
jgi:hypothetical protein